MRLLLLWCDLSPRRRLLTAALRRRRCRAGPDRPGKGKASLSVFVPVRCLLYEPFSHGLILRCCLVHRTCGIETVAAWWHTPV